MKTPASLLLSQLTRTLALAAVVLAVLIGLRADIAQSQPSLADSSRAPLRDLTEGTELEGIAQFIYEGVDEFNIPGMGVAIVKDDAVVLARGFGKCDVEGFEDVDANTLFQIGSTSKAFTATILAMLVEEGALSWGDRVIDHLPWFKLSDPWITRELRVHDLLENHSGLSQNHNLLWYKSGMSRREVMEGLLYQEQSDGFREKYQYHNGMFMVAGAVAEAVTGQTWEELVQARIFDPLGMVRTTPGSAGFDAGNVAMPHLWGVPPGEESEEGDGEGGDEDSEDEGEETADRLFPIAHAHIDNVGPAGSIMSCANDMALWLRAQINGGTVGETTLCAAESLAQLHMMRSPFDTRGLAALIPEVELGGYCRGWITYSQRGMRVVSHTGGIDGMGTIVAFVPKLKLGVAITMNRAGSNLHWMIVNEIIDRQLDTAAVQQRDWYGMLRFIEERQAANVEAVMAAAEAQRVADTEPTLPLADYVGNYSNGAFNDITITLGDDGRLHYTFGPNFTGWLEHWHYNTFVLHVPGDPVTPQFGSITFTIGPEGKVTEMNLDQIDDFPAFEPQAQ